MEKLIWRRGIASYKNEGGRTIYKIRFRVPVAPNSRKTRRVIETLTNCRNKTDAERVLDKRRAQVFDGIYRPRVAERPPTVRELAERWLELKSDLQSIAWYRRAFEKHLYAALGPKLVTDVSGADCTGYKLARLAGGAKKATVRNELRYFSSFMSFVIDEGWRQDNPVSRVSFGHIDNERARVLSAGERERLFCEIEKLSADDWLRPLFWTLYYTGARLGSVRKLEWSQVSFEHGWIELRRTKSGQMVRPMMGDVLTRELRAWRERCRGELVFPGDRSDDRPRSPHSVANQWAKLCAAAKVENLNRHDLRHNLVSTLRAMGADDKAIMKQSGHTTLAMLNRYTHPEADRLRATLDKMPCSDPTAIPDRVETTRTDAGHKGEKSLH
jgi:integrase